MKTIYDTFFNIHKIKDEFENIKKYIACGSILYQKKLRK